MLSSCIKSHRYCIYGPYLPKIWLNNIECHRLANTLHALGYSAYLMLDALWFFRWPLQASEMVFKC